MTCETFRSTFQAGDERPEILEHFRSCDACLEFAVQTDPDVLFRALGGADELIPPGGIDNFVGEVMQQIHVRGKESEMVHRRVVAWPYRWAAAAAVTFAMLSTLVINQQRQPAVPAGTRIAAVRPMTVHTNVTASDRPAVENYSSDTATIVEVPNEGASDVKIVMVFDESLPSNL
jgi:hypothetical protein